MGDRSPECAAEIRHTVQRDLARTAFELLQHVGTGAQSERKRRPGATRGQAHALFDEKLAVWSRRRRLAHDRREGPYTATTAVGQNPTAGRYDEEMPARRIQHGPLLSDPALPPVWAPGNQNLQPLSSVRGGGAPNDREDGLLAGDRPPPPHDACPGCAGVWLREHLVRFEQHHELLCRRHRRHFSGTRRRRGGQAGCRNGDHHASQRLQPPTGHAPGCAEPCSVESSVGVPSRVSR
jgi:hypothetical protein